MAFCTESSKHCVLLRSRATAQAETHTRHAQHTDQAMLPDTELVHPREQKLLCFVTDLYRQSVEDRSKGGGAFAIEATCTLRLCLFASSC